MIKFQLGPTGIEYLSTQLATGRALARALRELDLATGTIWTFADEHANPERLENLHSGRGDSRLQNEAATIEFIHGYLRKGLRSCAVFEDALAEAGDPVVARSNVPFFTCGKDVFNFLVGPENDLEQVRQLLRTSRSYRLVGALSEIEDIAPGQNVPFDALRLLATRAEHVIVGAWDGEGEIVWSRTRPDRS